MVFGPLRLLVLPEQLEGFLQIPGPHQRRVPAHQGGKPVFLIAVEVPRVLQQQPAGSFEARSLLGGELAPQIAADRIRGLIELLDDVEPVEQDQRSRGVFPYPAMRPT